MIKQIEVWYDIGADEWTVSMCDEDGEEIVCISTHDKEEDALDAGIIAAKNCGLQLFRWDLDGAYTTNRYAKVHVPLEAS